MYVLQICSLKILSFQQSVFAVKPPLAPELMHSILRNIINVTRRIIDQLPLERFFGFAIRPPFRQLIEDQYRRISLLGQPLSYIPSQGAVPLWPISKRAAKGAALSPNLQVVIPSRIFGTVVDFPKAVRRMDEPSRNGNS